MRLLPCNLLAKVINCFDFTFNNLESGLHALTAVALETTLIELTYLGLAVRAQNLPTCLKFRLHPVLGCEEDAGALGQLRFVA